MLLPLSTFGIMFSFLTKLLSALTSSVERFYSEISETSLNDVYSLPRSLLLTHSLLRLLTSRLISLNSISKGSKNYEYSIVFGGMAKHKPLHRTIFL